MANPCWTFDAPHGVSTCPEFEYEARYVARSLIILNGIAATTQPGAVTSRIHALHMVPITVLLTDKVQGSNIAITFGEWLYNNVPQHAWDDCEIWAGISQNVAVTNIQWKYVTVRLQPLFVPPAGYAGLWGQVPLNLSNVKVSSYGKSIPYTAGLGPQGAIGPQCSTGIDGEEGEDGEEFEENISLPSYVPATWAGKELRVAWVLKYFSDGEKAYLYRLLNGEGHTLTRCAALEAKERKA